MHRWSPKDKQAWNVPIEHLTGKCRVLYGTKGPRDAENGNNLHAIRRSPERGRGWWGLDKSTASVFGILRARQRDFKIVSQYLA